MKTRYRNFQLLTMYATLIAAIACASIGAAEATPRKKPKTTDKVPAVEVAYYIQPGDIVMFLGDSITADTRYYKNLYFSDIAKKYPELVDDPIAKYAGPGWGGDKLKFINAGLGGEASGGGKNRLPGLLADKKPTVVVICYGMNDARYGNPVGYKENLRAMVKLAKDAKCAVTVLSSPSVCTVGHADKVPLVKTLADLRDQAREVAADEGVLFADCYSLTREYEEKNNKDFTWGDGVHPNDDGHRMIADALESAWGFGKPLGKAGSPRPSIQAAAKDADTKKKTVPKAK